MRCQIVLKLPSFYQDRLGTNIGKAEKEVRVLAGSCKLLDSEGEWCYDAGEKRPLFLVSLSSFATRLSFAKTCSGHLHARTAHPENGVSFRFVSLRFVSSRLVSSRLVFKQSPDP